MKKTNRWLVIVLVVIIALPVIAQELKKGNLVGTHIMDVKLEPDVTLEQFTDFYVNKVIPELEKHRTGWKFYPVKWIRGEKADGFGVIIVIDSEANRDKLYNADGSTSELGKEINTKLQPVVDEMQKLGTITNAIYTDWLVY
ncbi:hypothetical protein HQ585_11805 [candidate division KSB1 bacterium]|nr:hypothetical protein [candidate division KSB1 bacterium]